jgi:chromate transporter
MSEQSANTANEILRGQSHGSLLEVLGVSTRLGLTSFGGPIAHLGYFHEEYVKRRKWIDEQSYADLVALCQFLPGPASSQVSIAIGIARAGLPGGFAAWLGFTLPSALALIAFAFGIGAFANAADAGWLHGLKIVAVAVVAQAVWGMARSLCPDRERATLAILASLVTLSWPTAFGQLSSIAIAGIVGSIIFSATASFLHSRTCGFQLEKGQESRLGLSSLHFSLAYRSCAK